MKAIRNGCLGLALLLLVGLSIVVYRADDSPFVKSYGPFFPSPDGKYIGAWVLISNGRRKDRTLGVCAEAETPDQRQWVLPFEWDQVNLVSIDWPAPDVVRVTCWDQTEGDLPTSITLTSPPVTIEMKYLNGSR